LISFLDVGVPDKPPKRPRLAGRSGLEQVTHDAPCEVGTDFTILDHFPKLALVSLAELARRLEVIVPGPWHWMAP
jgi:hypothetical protein